MTRNLVVGAVYAVCVAAAADPVDGFQWGQAWWAPYEGLTPQYWEDGVVAKDGGVAYFTGTESPKLKFTTPWVLHGIDFGNVKLSNSSPSIQGGQLTLTGDAFIKGTGRASNSSGYDQYAIVESTVSGTGANTLTVNGLGILRVDTPFANFGSVVAVGGGLNTTQSGALFTSSGDFAIHGGTVNWTPSAGGDAVATLPATSYGNGAGLLRVNKGSGTSATLTLASLTRETDGAALAVEAKSGLAALGATEKVKVTAAPALVNGMLDPGIVTYDPSVESWPVSFTTYDTEKGIVPFTATTPLASAGATDVARVTATNALSESKQVAALVIDNTANLELASGVTLKVGDDSAAHRAGVIFNHQNKRNTDNDHQFLGAGTLDFGASPGVIWTSTPSKSGSWGGNRRLGVKTRITGSAGVTFASRWRETSQSGGIFDLYNGFCNWTGPTRSAGSMLWVQESNALPAGDIYVVQGENNAAGQLRFWAGGWTIPQNIFLSGYGPMADGDGVLWLPDGTTTFSGVITLVDDTWIASDKVNKSAVNFLNEVRGPGSLIFNYGGTLNFLRPNSFGQLVMPQTTTITLITNGTFGTGRIWQKGGSATYTYEFRGVNGLTVTNEFRQKSGTAQAIFRFARMALDTDVKFASSSLSSFSNLKIGGKVDLGKFSAAGARATSAGSFGRDEISASRAGAELGLGTDEDCSFALPVSDGAGTLSIIKKGTGLLELPPIERTYTGATRVEAGTLRLNDDPLLAQSLVYRLDASREEDFTKDASGNVTAWRSCGGSSDITFTKSFGTVTWGAAEAKVNDLSTLTTMGAKLVGNKKLEHRTVILVCRMQQTTTFSGPFGASNNEIGDYGVRLNSGDASPSPTTTWDTTLSHFNFVTTKEVRHDGVANNARANVGETQILTFIHDRENWPPAVSWGKPTYTATFTPVLGTYQTGATRTFNGDYCEVLAFDRVLSETEIRKVENYLSKKWKNTTLWTDEQMASSATGLPAATALSVAAGATFDLNGISTAVASLAGSGTITNSSAKTATLTVTGGNTFRGRIAARVKVVADSTGDVAVDAGGTLAVSGTAALTAHSLLPPTDGLAYWCDAGKPETILCDASHNVTSWVSRAASSASALINNSGNMPNNNTTRLKPLFDETCATAMQGRPGVYFNNAVRALWANAKSPVRTVFVVAMLTNNQNNCNGLWGLSGKDCGFRFSNNSTTMEGATSVVRPTTKTDRVILDETASTSFGLNTVRVFSARFGSPDPAFYASIGLESPTPSRTTVIGAYFGNPALQGFIGEVIAYNRVLSDVEMVRVENYLKAKWQDTAWTDGQAPAESEAACAGTLEIASGANVTVANGTTVGTLSGAGTLTGDVVANQFAVEVKPNGTTDTLTVNGALTLAPNAALLVTGAGYLQEGGHSIFLRATGITGTFAESNLEKPNGFHVTPTTASVYRSSGMCVIFR